MFEQEIANCLGRRGIRISQHEVEDDAAEYTTAAPITPSRTTGGRAPQRASHAGRIRHRIRAYADSLEAVGDRSSSFLQPGPRPGPRPFGAVMPERSKREKSFSPCWNAMASPTGFEPVLPT